MLDSYWHPLATSSELWTGLHPSLVLELNPFNYVLNPPAELQQWVRRRGLDILCKHKPPDGVVTNMPPLVPFRGQPSNASRADPGAFGDGDSTGSETSTDSEPGDPQETATDLTNSRERHTCAIGVVDGASSEEEDTCDYEHPGQYYVESGEQERDRLFGGIGDADERERQYRAYCRSIDELELGYG